MLIFLDCEFTDFGPRMELISIGLAAQDGRTFYGERNDYHPWLCSDFVNQVIVPQLGKQPECAFNHRDLSAALLAWLQPYREANALVCYDFDGDWHLMTRLLGQDFPAWLGRRDVYRKIDSLLKEKFFADTGLQDHHALNDARANMAAYRPELGT